MASDFQLIDLSHTISHGLITYKGLPAPVISDHLSREASRKNYEPGTEFHIGKIEMVANTGTYIDSPFHRYPDGADLAGLDLHSLANVDGIVVKHPGPGRVIEADAIRGLDVKGKAILFQTNWDRHWRTDEYWNGQHPYVAEELAQLLVNAGAVLVGIDSYNIDNTATGARPVHTVLLKSNIPIVEHMCGLRELPESGFKFFAVPVKVRDFGTFPVRAFAVVPK